MAPRPSFTLGIEEEFQIVDPATRVLKVHIQFMHTIVKLKTGADCQREVLERTKSFPAVDDYILKETRHVRR